MSGKPGAPGCELLAAVPGLKQLTNTRLPLLSPAPFALSSVSSSSRFQFSFHFTLGFLLLSLLSLFSLPPPEALLGNALEQETESGSVGQLRQQAQAGCALGVT